VALDGHAAPTADPLGGIFRLTVDARSLKEMIAAGGYDWTNSDITPERFPITVNQLGDWEAKYFHFNLNLESPDAKCRIETADSAKPWQAAHIGHLLALGANHPDEQRTFPIIALGSVAKVSGRRRVPYLGRLGSDRNLRLDWWGIGWFRSCRFLAVRKVSVAPASEDAA